MFCWSTRNDSIWKQVQRSHFTKNSGRKPVQLHIRTTRRSIFIMDMVLFPELMKYISKTSKLLQWSWVQSTEIQSGILKKTTIYFKIFYKHFQIYKANNESCYHISPLTRQKGKNKKCNKVVLHLPFVKIFFFPVCLFYIFNCSFSSFPVGNKWLVLEDEIHATHSKSAN